MLDLSKLAIALLPYGFTPEYDGSLNVYVIRKQLAVSNLYLWMQFFNIEIGNGELLIELRDSVTSGVGTEVTLCNVTINSEAEALELYINSVPDIESIIYKLSELKAIGLTYYPSSRLLHSRKYIKAATLRGMLHYLNHKYKPAYLNTDTWVVYGDEKT